MKFKEFDKVKCSDGTIGVIEGKGETDPNRFYDGNDKPIHEPCYRVRFLPHSFSWYQESELEKIKE